MTAQKTEAIYSAIGFYHKFFHQRADAWNLLKSNIAALAKEPTDSVNSNELRKSVVHALNQLEQIEEYTAFPSKSDFQYLWRLYHSDQFEQLEVSISRVGRAITSGIYRRREIILDQPLMKMQKVEDDHQQGDKGQGKSRPYFELLIIDNFTSVKHEEVVRKAFLEMRHVDDRYVYDVVAVSNFEDALVALLINPNIQACIIRQSFSYKSKHEFEFLKHYLPAVTEEEFNELDDANKSGLLGKALKNIRPEVDLFLHSNQAMEEAAAGESLCFNRIFYREPDIIDQHHSILRGIYDRYQTPFFSALRQHSRKPIGVFHAMPLSRGKSVFSSNWIQDMADFYGRNIFMAETSATSGGLDSLLQPRGPMKKAQELASKAFGSKDTYFVTNGTSTANKIVVQALIKPGDIVLVDRDCHKSHHYGLMLMGANVSYLDSYPLNKYSMYGGVPLRDIKKKLLEFKRAGQLDRVKMLLLTNCTFDGIVYNTRRVMEECLAIKPDLAFLWDEAWFAFATFNPIYRPRTGMHAARKLKHHYRSEEYAQKYQAFKTEFDKLDPADDATWLDRPLMPDPAKVRMRVYTTHSTHKTLTSLRQGSMIHVYDEDFQRKSRSAFHEAYMTHTSTSPNYQILASLDVGRRQVDFEGYELVHKQIEVAMALREQIYNHKGLSKYFSVLVNKDLVPDEYRPSGVESYYDPNTGWSRMEDAWSDDEFVVDPTRITLFIGHTGVDGDTFKNRYLMDTYGIQVNKTSRNTVLFMTNIGTSRSAIAYLMGVLMKIARDLDARQEENSPAEQLLAKRRIISLTKDLPPLPDFSRFHRVFSPGFERNTSEGDIRSAYFTAYDDESCEYLRIDNGQLQNKIRSGVEVVSASFVIPYPPGFPILVPGQVISEDILEFMLALDVKEIHGYRPDMGVCVFRDAVLELADTEAGAEVELIEGKNPETISGKTVAPSKSRNKASKPLKSKATNAGSAAATG
jgi:arginine decarboxylase